MSKPTKKGSLKPMHWVMILGTVGILYVAMSGDSGAKKVVAKKPVAIKKKAKDDLFIPADYKAKFSDMTEPVKNAFKPLVSKSSSTGLTGSIGANVVPGYLVGGESWAYTGNAELDGVKSALLENTKTGEGVFLKVGENWKLLRVVSIKTEGLVVSGGENGEITIPVADDTGKSPAPLNTNPAVRAGGQALAPVNPALAGTIGDGMALEPTLDDTANTRGNGRRGRRNRGN